MYCIDIGPFLIAVPDAVHERINHNNFNPEYGAGRFYGAWRSLNELLNTPEIQHLLNDALEVEARDDASVVRIQVRLETRFPVGWSNFVKKNSRRERAGLHMLSGEGWRILTPARGNLVQAEPTYEIFIRGYLRWYRGRRVLEVHYLRPGEEIGPWDEYGNVTKKLGVIWLPNGTPGITFD